MVIKLSMQNSKRKSKQSILNNVRTTKYSEQESDEVESTLIELNDSSIALYSAIQDIWSEYQEHFICFPCLDILASLAAGEKKD